MVIFLVIAAGLLNIFALAAGHFNWPALMFGDIATFVILAGCDIRWGHTLRLA
jgi:hypothetical protein